MNRGDVIFWPMYLFEDGSASNKLLVVMGCDKDDVLLLLRTTSQERRDRPDAHGCHHDQSVFRFKDKPDPFDKPTWIQYEMPILKEKREVLNAKGGVRFSLGEEQMRAVINCYKRSPEISNWLAAYLV